MVERKITFTEDFVLSERDGATDTEVFKIDTTGGNTIDCKVGRLAVNPATAIDALIDFNNSTTRWVLGLDADDAGRFKLAVGSSLSSTTLLEVGDVDGEGVTIYSKDATATSHAVLKINSSAADAQLTFTGSSGSWSMGHREEDDAFFINAGTSLSTGHIAQYDSPGNTLGWDFLGNKARFRDTDGAADGRVEIVPETGGDAYISFIGDGETFSLGNYAFATDRFRLTKSAGLTSSLIIDGGTDIFEFFLTTDMRIKHAVGSTDGFITLNPSDAAAAYIAFTGTTSTWSAGIDTAENFVISEAQGFGGTDRFVIGADNLEVYVTDNMRVKNATSDTSGWVTIQPSSNDDAKIVFQGPSTDAFTMGRNHGLGDFVITSGGTLDATPLANSDSTGHWVFSCPVDNRIASEMGNSSMTFWFNETANILQFSVKDAAGATHTGQAVMAEE